MIQITISQIIALVDELRPNRFSDELKIAWLSDLDRQIYLEIFKTHENCPQEPEAYLDQTAELLVPEPFARELYSFYLESCIDRENGEIGRFNQSAALYNAAFQNFQNHYNRRNMPKSHGPFRLKGEMPCPRCPF